MILEMLLLNKTICGKRKGVLKVISLGLKTRDNSA